MRVSGSNSSSGGGGGGCSIVVLATVVVVVADFTALLQTILVVAIVDIACHGCGCRGGYNSCRHRLCRAAAEMVALVPAEQNEVRRRTSCCYSSSRNSRRRRSGCSSIREQQQQLQMQLLSNAHYYDHTPNAQPDENKQRMKSNSVRL